MRTAGAKPDWILVGTLGAMAILMLLDAAFDLFPAERWYSFSKILIAIGAICILIWRASVSTSRSKQ